MNLNKVLLIGRLTRDPETKMLPSGQPVATFGLATDRHYTNKAGEKKQEVEFHNVVLFGRLAEIAAQYMTKGSLAYLEGRLRTRNWEDKSGGKRYRTEIIIERLQLGPRSAGKTTFTSPNSQNKQERQDSINNTPKGKTADEEIPVIEEEEINVKDIPF